MTKSKSKILEIAIISILILILIISDLTIFYFSPEGSTWQEGIPYAEDIIREITNTKNLINVGHLTPDNLIFDGYEPAQFSKNKISYPLTSIYLHSLTSIFPSLFSFYGFNIIFLHCVCFFLVYLISKRITREFKSYLIESLLPIFTITIFVFVPAIIRDIKIPTTHTWLSYVAILGSMLIVFSCRLFTLKSLYMNIYASIALLLLSVRLAFYPIGLAVFVIPYILYLIIFSFKSKKNIKKKLVAIFSIFMLGLLLIPIAGVVSPYLEGAGSAQALLLRITNPFLATWTKDLSYFTIIEYLGLTITILSIIAILKWNSTPQNVKFISFSAIVLLLFFASFTIGINIFNKRFALHLWIPAIFLASVGLIYALEYIKQRFPNFLKISLTVTFVIISLLSISNFTEKFSPETNKGAYAKTPKAFLEAFYWIGGHSRTTDILLVTYHQSRPYLKWIEFYSGRPATFSWFQVQPKETNIKKSAVRKFILDDAENDLEPISGNTERQRRRFAMINSPGSEESQQYLKDYNIKYILTWKDSPWEDNLSIAPNLEEKFSNDEVRIFAVTNIQ